MQRRADLHHARAAQDMFKRIATAINASCADDLDGRIQSLVERMDIGKRGRFDVFAAAIGAALSIGVGNMVVGEVERDGAVSDGLEGVVLGAADSAGPCRVQIGDVTGAGLFKNSFSGHRVVPFEGRCVVGVQGDSDCVGKAAGPAVLGGEVAEEARRRTGRDGLLTSRHDQGRGGAEQQSAFVAERVDGE